MWDENRAEGSLFDFLFITLHKSASWGGRRFMRKHHVKLFFELQSPQVTILSRAAEKKNVARNSTLARCEPVTRHLSSWCGVCEGGGVPGALSLAWLDERVSGRLWRSRFMRLKPTGRSGSDMVSRFSVEAKDTLLAWSARAGCGGLSLVTRGVRVCRAKKKKKNQNRSSVIPR